MANTNIPFKFKYYARLFEKLTLTSRLCDSAQTYWNRVYFEKMQTTFSQKKNKTRVKWLLHPWTTPHIWISYHIQYFVLIFTWIIRAKFWLEPRTGVRYTCVFQVKRGIYVLMNISMGFSAFFEHFFHGKWRFTLKMEIFVWNTGFSPNRIGSHGTRQVFHLKTTVSRCQKQSDLTHFIHVYICMDLLIRIEMEILQKWKDIHKIIRKFECKSNDFTGICIIDSWKCFSSKIGNKPWFVEIC